MCTPTLDVQNVDTNPSRAKCGQPLTCKIWTPTKHENNGHQPLAGKSGHRRLTKWKRAGEARTLCDGRGRRGDLAREGVKSKLVRMGRASRTPVVVRQPRARISIRSEDTSTTRGYSGWPASLPPQKPYHYHNRKVVRIASWSTLLRTRERWRWRWSS